MKTSIVYATIKCIVRHEDDQDPEDVLCEANYEVVVEPDDGKQTPMIVKTEMVEIENRGECHPVEHYLLEDQRRDEKKGLYGDFTTGPQHEEEFKIPATIISDCGSLKCDFDALPYFRNASDEELLKLHAEMYCNSYEADAVAEFMEDFDPNVKRFFEFHQTSNNSSLETIGFEVTIDSDSVVNWIKDNNPELHQKLEDYTHGI